MSNGRLPSYRALTECLQTIVRDRNDIDIETGELEYGEARPGPFETLVETLTIGQRRTAAMLGIAEICVWPQLSPIDAALIADSITNFPMQGPIQKSQFIHPTDSIFALLAYERALSEQPSSPTPSANSEQLRRAIHGIARFASDPALYWEQWFRRIVPQVLRLDMKTATQMVREVLATRLPLSSKHWNFVANKIVEGGVCSIDIVGSEMDAIRVALFTTVRFANRRLEATVHPSLCLDGYRIGYIFQNVFVERALDDVVTLGSYDEAVCFSEDGTRIWSFPAL